MKIWTRQGGVDLSASDLAEFDKAAWGQLRKAKRAKVLRLGQRTAHFKVTVRCSLPTEMEGLLRTVLNIRKHGKAYAPEVVEEDFLKLHAQVNRGHVLQLPVQFDLETGELTIDWPSTT